MKYKVMILRDRVWESAGTCLVNTESQAERQIRILWACGGNYQFKVQKLCSK